MVRVGDVVTSPSDIAAAVAATVIRDRERSGSGIAKSSGIRTSQRVALRCVNVAGAVGNERVEPNKAQNLKKECSTVGQQFVSELFIMIYGFRV